MVIGVVRTIVRTVTSMITAQTEGLVDLDLWCRGSGHSVLGWSDLKLGTQLLQSLEEDSSDILRLRVLSSVVGLRRPLMHVEAIPRHTDVTLDPQELQSPQTLCSHRVAGSLGNE